MFLERQILRFCNSAFQGAVLFRAEERRTAVVGVLLGLHLGQVDLIGFAAAAAFFPHQLPFYQLAKGGCDSLLTDTQLPGQGQPGIDDKDFAVFIDPALAAGELKAVEQKGVGQLGLQAQVGVLFRNEASGFVVLRMKTADMMIPEDARSPYR